ncbi:MAG: hypothetical protein H6Q73_4348 [Firmicutes bacterium]|nr:hypothetical protein [Bacillota bacterium]
MHGVFNLQRFVNDGVVSLDVTQMEKIAELIEKNSSNISFQSGTCISEEQIEDIAASLDIAADKSITIGGVIIPSTKSEIIVKIIELVQEIISTDSRWVKIRDTIIIVILISAYSSIS